MPDNIDFENACEAIRQERTTYAQSNPPIAIKILYIVSTVFFFAAFGALVLVPFTDVSLLQATCLFVIHYTVAPSEADLAQGAIKGATVDLANIRASLDVLRNRRDV